MKKLLLVLTMCLVLIGQAHAQRYLPGQKGMQVTLGAVDGFKLSKGDGQAFSIGIAMATYTKNGNRWVFGGEYLQKQNQYKDMLIPVSQFTGEGGYYLNFFSDKSKTVFLSIGASALAGYETINKGKELLKDGARIENKDSFLYGGAITFEIETYITDRTVLLLNARERYLPSSDFSSFHFQLSVGVKFIIN
ncbi:conjugal transfer protein TraO [Dysgonomonas sp. ZJ709]|uniref:conjugal transfer protein TraO n=1 Tax=Dysgonomonas sp. ZJ709 TaxID=2709797 RepID=UPI0013EAA101|nr:conjugal transfer protein TraO [Dysgonomonas sp. ZJ709]